MGEEAGRATVTTSVIRIGRGKEEEKDGESLEEGMSAGKGRVIELGQGSQVVYNPRLIAYEEAWKWFEYLNDNIPWTRPTIRVFGRSCVQPRDTCYVASEGLTKLVYSGYQPQPHSWDQFPPLLELLRLVENALPGSRFNSLLLNRYQGGNDYVGWHADDESLYGPTPEIASLSFGCDREFFLKKKPSKLSPALQRAPEEAPAKKRLKKSNSSDQHCFTLKHGSMLVMRGYTQRDWIHSVPKRTKVDATRINLTFRRVL
ncbi:hypothetical protein vseg_016580 [Gypsophila vaccaria]